MFTPTMFSRGRIRGARPVGCPGFGLDRLKLDIAYVYLHMRVCVYIYI